MPDAPPVTAADFIPQNPPPLESHRTTCDHVPSSAQNSAYLLLSCAGGGRDVGGCVWGSQCDNDNIVALRAMCGATDWGNSVAAVRAPLHA